MVDEQEIINRINDNSFEKALAKKAKNYKTSLIVRITLFVIFIVSVLLYPVFPACQLQGMNINGNYLLSKDDVLKMTEVNRLTPNIFVNTEKIENNLEKSPIIESAYIEWKPAKMVLTIDEVAAMVSYKGETYLSNTLTINELETAYPDFTYNFQATNVPEFIGDIFGAFTKERKGLFLNNLKSIDRDILTEVKYLDYRGAGESYVLTEGFVCFYFLGSDNIYNRVCVKEANMDFFLTNEGNRLTTILNLLENDKDAKVMTDMIDSSISYRSITCYYGNVTINGEEYENPCVVKTN